MRRLVFAALAMAATPARAHGGHEHAIGWTFDAQVTLPLALALGLYLIGLTRLRSRSARGRRELARAAWLYLGGLAVLAGALVSPLHEAGEVSFTMHMVEHETIMLGAALLLVAARPGPVLLWGLPAAARQAAAPVLRWRFWRALARPATATAIQAAVLIVWHLPALFDRALRSEAIHVVQHMCFVASALLFWWAVLPLGEDRAGRLVSALCLFVTSVIGGGLGALMTLGGSPWYPAYAAMGMTPFGLTPAEDQQLAGVIMWVPGGAFHLAAALIVLAGALRSTPEGLDHRVGDRRQAT